MIRGPPHLTFGMRSGAAAGVAILLSLHCLAGAQSNDPALLTFSELRELYQQADPPPPLRAKLQALLTTPFVRNNAWEQGVRPLAPNDPQTGKMLRVAEWNIERGLEFDAVRYAFSDPRKFNALMEDKGFKADDAQCEKIREQIAILEQDDVLVLNEVDWGLNRTLFRNVAAELAGDLNMNYAYGVEFVESGPDHHGFGPASGGAGSGRSLQGSGRRPASHAGSRAASDDARSRAL